MAHGAFSRAAPAGTREGKVVVAQHRDIAIWTPGGRFTVKIYSNEKVAKDHGSWRHLRIILASGLGSPGYHPIVLELEDGQEDMQAIAELITVTALIGEA